MKDFEELMNLSPSSPFCLFTYYCDNLGDHIQTLALLQHVTPRILVPRDQLTPQRGLSLIANGWLTGGKLPRTEDFRHVRYVGVHVTRGLRNIETANAMKGCGVVGSRDPATSAFLTKHGVANYLTRCATLTFPTYSGKREGIYCVDVRNDIKESLLKSYKDALFVTHDLPGLSLDQVNDKIIASQFREAYALLARYRTAELVITARLHATLPCMAFGTPVIYVGVPSILDDRITVLDRLGVKMVTGIAGSIPPSALRKPPPVDASRFRERYVEFLRQSIDEIDKH